MPLKRTLTAPRMLEKIFFERWNVLHGCSVIANPLSIGTQIMLFSFFSEHVENTPSCLMFA